MRDVKLGAKAELERQLRNATKAKQQAETAKTQAAKTKIESEDESRSIRGVYEATSHYYKGAGKSSLLDLMWELMGIGGSGGKLFSCTETDFVMLKLLSSTTSIPLVFDEYKPFDMPPLRLKALTRMLRRVSQVPP